MPSLSKLTTFVGALALLSKTSHALDVKIKDITCNETLPISLVEGMRMTCGGIERCTFGDTATFNGQFAYNGVEDSGVIDNTVYMTSDLEFVSITYHLFKFYPVDLCHELIQSGNDDENDEDGENNCPADGNYPFTAYYSLPAYEEKTSWLATGWSGGGEIFMYETASTENLVGHCTLKLHTYVTANTTNAPFTPSAALSVFLLAGAIIFTIATCVYCKCKSKYGKKVVDDSESKATKGSRSSGGSRESTTHFTRMDDAQSEITESVI